MTPPAPAEVRWWAAGRELVLRGAGRPVGSFATLHALVGAEWLLVLGPSADVLDAAPGLCHAEGVVEALERGVLYAEGPVSGGPYRGAAQGARGPAYALVPTLPGEALSRAVRVARGGAPWPVREAAALGAAIADALPRSAPPLDRLAPPAVVLREGGGVALRSPFLDWAVTARAPGVLSVHDAWLSYLRPESLDRVLARAGDTYGLGVLLWELLAGAPLFARDSDFATLRAVSRDAVPPLSALRPEVPTALAAVVGAMAARDPNLRPTAAGASAVLRAHGGVGAHPPPSDASEPVPYLSDR